MIAVDLGSDILGRHLVSGRRDAQPGSVVGEWMNRLQEKFGARVPAHSPDEREHAIHA